MTAETLLFKQLEGYRSTWMARPDDWVWTTPARHPQSFGPAWRLAVGLANLLWLALDMDRPPDHPYDLRDHPLCTLLIMYGTKMELGGLPIFSQSEALTLVQFSNLCGTERFTAPAPIPDITRRLAVCANRRLKHAHT